MKSKIISLRDKILCDQNIYSAIYSIDTSIVEKTLLSKSDIGQLQKLSCKVHADKQYIERIQSRLKKYLDGDELFQVEVYFRFSTVWYKRLRNKHLTKYLKNSSNDLGIVLFLAFCGAMLSNNS